MYFTFSNLDCTSYKSLKKNIANRNRILQIQPKSLAKKKKSNKTSAFNTDYSI